ncbi:MAG: hypothetical protein ACFFDN_42520, partial [Candidatus Hodarchaeota archaeon]
LAYSLQFDLGFSLVPTLLPVSAMVLICLLKNGRYREIVVAVTISVGFYLLYGVKAAVAWFSVIQVAIVLWRLVRIGEFLFWLLVFLTGFEATTLVHWVLLPFGVATPLAWFADLELALFYIIAPLAPLVVLVIILIVFLKLLKPQYLIIAIQFFRVLSPPEGELKEEEIRLHPQIFLIASVVLSVVAALYPYSRYINPDRIAFGVDFHYYIDWMGSVTKDLYSAFTVANGSRPVVLWLIYGVQRISGLEFIDTIKYLPILLNPLLVISVYFMVSRATKDWEWAVLASFFTTLGFTTTVGMYSYYLTNILALILIFSAIGFLFNSLKTGCKASLVLSFMLGSLTVFTHPWTFYQYYIVILFTAIYISRMNFEWYQYKMPYTFIFFLLITVIMDIMKNILFRGGDVSSFMISIIPHLSGISNFWNSNIFAFRQRFGGLFSNTLFLGLVAFGSFKLNNKKIFQLFLNLMLITSSTFYIFADGIFQTRILFNIPFGILSSFCLLNLLRNTAVSRNIRFIGLIFTVEYMLIYMIRSVANLI